MTTTCPKCHGIHTLIAPKFCPACGEMLLELQAAPIRGRLEPYPEHVINTGTDCGKSTTVNTGESFTPDQMVAAIGHWLQFGERMLAMNQQAGYFSGCGWAARALAAARDFIEKAGAE